ncbi:MAG TPA: hypothetical protein VFF06_02010 [Polyangia bacterium]|nr:hypothetical protein [Polyangia bacterium]
MIIEPASIVLASRVSRTIVDPLDGERVVALVPDLAPVVDNGAWQHPNLFSGRALGEQPFIDEQNERAARLALRGRMVTAGVVVGFEIDLELAGLTRFLHVAPGYGVCPSGEDLSMPAPLRVDLAGVPVVGVSDPVDVADPDVEAGRPPVSIVVLTPSTAEIIANLDDQDPCEQDPSQDSFADWQRMDGFKLRLVRWPDSWALPPAGPRRRNLLVNAIFEAEAQLAPDELLPWEKFGLPIALLSLGAADATFVDRSAVVRAGGHPRRRSAIVRSPSLLLRQARMQQLAEQLNEMTGVPMNQLVQSFRHLPPCGILPRAAFALRPTQNLFFPDSFAIDAMPIPVEQLDGALKASASLQPFDLDAPDYLRVLVPVPQAYYEPRLLVTEVIDPAFQAAIDHFLTEAGLRRANRDTLWQLIHDVTERLYGTDKATVIPTADPDAVEQEVAVNDPTDEETIEIAKPRVQYNADLDKVNTGLAMAPLSDKEKALFIPPTGQPMPSLDDGLTALKGSIDKTDDAIDFGFLRSQTDIYRIRQHMLGAEAGTRLATSPALASIARGETAVAVKQELSDFFSKTLKTARPGPSLPQPPAIRRFVFAQRAPTASRLRFAALNLGTSFTAPTFSPSPSVSTSLRNELTVGGNLASTNLARLLDGGGGTNLLPPPSRAGTFNNPSDAVTGQSALPGADFVIRTTAIAERVLESPANEARNWAVTNKHDSVIALLDAAINLDDVVVPNALLANGDVFNASGKQFVVGSASATLFFEDVVVPGAPTTKKLSGVDVVLDPTQPTVKTRLAPFRTIATYRDTDTYKGRVKLGDILNEYPLPQDSDESGVYSNTIAAIEDAIRMFRYAEGIVQRYRNALAAVTAARDDIRLILAAADARLASVQRELDEQRHDVATARALKLDEDHRLADINQRRDAVIAHHVSFLAYVRARTADGVLDAPAHTLDPAIAGSIIPQCLADHGATPPDLQAMLELFREGPVSWFPQLETILDELDRLEAQQRVLRMAKLRAYTRYQLGYSPWTWQASAGRYTDSLDRVFSAQRQVVSALRLRAAAIDLGIFATLSWQDARVLTGQHVSVGDLIDGGHGRADLGQRAAQELQDLAAIASCLHDRLSRVLPRIRLDWAEQLSQYDAGVSLRNLASLPRWGELPFLDRHDMQEMVDWLYGQVSPSVPEATSLMHDLVRVCVLLASHAPVNQIIAGHMYQAAPAVRGGNLHITIDPSLVRVGMDVFVYTQPNRPTVRGTVEDVVGGVARARILDADDGVVNVAKGATVHFQHPQLGYTRQSYKQLS